MQTIRRTFHRNRFVCICDQPVELRARKLLRKRRSDQIHFRKQAAHRLHAVTLRKDPWQKFILCHIFPAFFHFLIYRISDKIQACHANALFVDGIVVKRIAACHMRHAKNCVMRLSVSHIPERDRKLPWH